MLKPAKKSDYKSLHLDNLDRRYLGNICKDTEMPDIKHITSISNYSINKPTISTQSKSSIQSTWKGFQFIKFDNG